MRIGELAQRAGISPSTIHYYERIDLLRPADREGASYRYYDETVYRQLEKITARKRLGSNLDDIAAPSPSIARTPVVSKEKVLEILEAQLTKTDAQFAELMAFRSDLENNIARMKSLIDHTRRTA